MALVVVGGMGQQDGRRVGWNVETRPEFIFVFGPEIS